MFSSESSYEDDDYDDDVVTKKIVAVNPAPHQCGSCRRTYNEGKRLPRILVCSHTFCTSCLEDLIEKNDCHCPSCDLPLVGDSIDGMTVNLSTLEFLKHLEPQAGNEEDETQRATLRKNYKLNCSIDTFPSACDRGIEQCQEAQKQVKELLLEIETLQENITKKNSRLELEILPRLKTVVDENTRLMEDLRQTKMKMHNHKTNLDNKALEMAAFKEEMASGRRGNLICVKEFDATFRCIEEVQRKLKEEKMRFAVKQKEAMRLAESVKLFLRTQNQDKIDVIFSSANSSNKQAIHDDDEEEEEVEEAEEVGKLQTIMAEEVQAMGPNIKRKAIQGKLFAVQIYGDRRRYGRISFTRERKIYLHHLNDDSIPPDASLVVFDELMRLVNPASTLAFIQLKSSSSERTLETILIKLSMANLRAKNFCLLCTGENGPSYVNSKVLEHEREGRFLKYVRFGDYECNDGTGGKSLISQSAYYQCSEAWRKGTVRGVTVVKDTTLHDFDDIGSQFDIFARTRSEKFLNNAFGMVLEGMQVVEEIASLNNPSEIIISDCGIIIPDA